ncbi:MAG: tRNA 2-thiouridine(34) synthase MnmA [Parcubacteria group bacterium]|nr:tRNA 2-thiouridine(34) synthase MnmA [Parcubacteria group bacterium]
MKKKQKVFVAMSGGVDSSVAVFLLKKEGYDVEGITMKTFCYKDAGGRKNCCGLEGILNAKKTCEILDIPHHVLDVSEKFKKEIIKNFISEYKSGKTPNPCVRCNQFIKFDELLKFIKKQKGDFIATGHYAQIKRTKNSYKLFRGKDEKKDQTYFLYNLTQKQLSQILFPLGEYKKEEIKKIAKKYKLKTSEKESQEICFINTTLYDFLSKNIDAKPGKILTTDKEIIGNHRGLPFYTIGQRAGVGGRGPYFVVKLDIKKNQLVVTNKLTDPALHSKELKVKNVNWISDEGKKASVQIRYNDTPADATIKKSGNFYLVKFKKPRRAVTPGQSAVFYKKEECLGGGIIA